MKRLIALLTVVFVFTGSVSVIAENADQKKNTAPVTLTVYYDSPNDDGMAAECWGSDPVSRTWIADTGVNIDLVTAIDENHTQLNMRIANRDYPDILLCKRSYSMLDDLAANGIIVRLNELETTAAPGFVTRNMGANSILAVRERFRTNDIYAMPIASMKVEDMKHPDVSNCGSGIMVLKSVYQAIGQPDMTTIDGFLQALRTVKQAYPDLIPAQASRNASTDSEGNPRCIYKLLPMFDLHGYYYYDPSTNRYMKYWYSPHFLSLLHFANTLYNEELMDPTELTCSTDVLRSRVFSGKVFCLMYTEASAVDWLNSELKSAGVDDEWFFVRQPSINEETGYTNDDMAGGVDDWCLVILNTPNAGRAMQWIDYLMTDKAQIEMVAGIQGNSWDYDSEGRIMIYTDVLAVPDDIKRSVYGINLYYMFRQALYSNIISKYVSSGTQQEAISLMNGYYRDYSFILGTSPEIYSPDSKEIKLYTNIIEYYSSQILQLIMCVPDKLETMYADTLSKIESLGQPILNDIIDAAYKGKEDMLNLYGNDLNLSYMNR